MSESTKIKILDISYYMTCPPISGGALRMISPFANMTKEHGVEVDFLFSSWEQDYIEFCRDFLMQYPVISDVVGVKVRHYLNQDVGIPHEFSRDVWVTMSSELRDKAIEMVTCKHYDVIQIEHSQLAWIVPLLRLASPDTKFVLDLHNAEHLIFKRWLEYASPDQKEEIEKKYTSLFTWESKVWKWFDAAFTVSPIESQMFRELGGCENVFEVPTGGGIDPERYEPKDEDRAKPYDILYLGTMEWFPNAHGLMWFIKEAFPYILEQRPEAKLHIVGFGNPDGELYNLAEAHPNIKFWGQQKDDKKFFHGARVFIVPLWIGAGARVKIPTAWAAKVPIVSTYLGAEGLEARNMENIILADDPREFAEGVLRLFSDKEIHRQIVENAFETVKKYYTIGQCIETLKSSYRELFDLPAANQNIPAIKSRNIQNTEDKSERNLLKNENSYSDKPDCTESLRRYIDGIKTRLSYSAEGQDRFIYNYLFERAKITKDITEIRYLDIGTCHPIDANNTYLFYCLNAKGVCVEPNTDLVSLIKEKRPKDIVISCGIVTEEVLKKSKHKELDYYVFHDDIWRNTFSKKTADWTVANLNLTYRTTSQKAMSINEIFQLYFKDQEIDILDIDIEGLDEIVLKDIDYDKYSPRIICTENCGEPIDDFMKQKGYTLIGKLSCDKVFAKDVNK